MTQDPKDVLQAVRRALAPKGVPEPIDAPLRDELVARGWRPPVCLDQPRGMAGAQRSAEVREGRKRVRQLFVRLAFEKLSPAMRDRPWSEKSMDELEARYRALVIEHLDKADREKIFKTAPFKADRDQLVRDLRELGIRSGQRKNK